MQCRQCRKSPFERRSQISQCVYEHLLRLAPDVSVVTACLIPFEAPPRARVIVVVISDYETQSTLPGAFPYGGHSPLDISQKCDGTQTEHTRNPTFIYTDWDLGLRLVF